MNKRLLTQQERDAVYSALPPGCGLEAIRRALSAAQDAKSLKAVGARLLRELGTWLQGDRYEIMPSVHTTLNELVESLQCGKLPSRKEEQDEV